MRNLTDRFPDAKPLKTKAGAMARLEGFDTIDFEYVVVEVNDGWLPIAILGQSNSYLAGSFAHNGICAMVVS